MRCAVWETPKTDVISPAIHGSHMANTYDFYKPKLDSEYPEVDGPLSITTYLGALDQSYSRFREKTLKFTKKPFSLADVDYPCFHSPYGKLVQKGHARLVRRCLRSMTTRTPR